MNKSTTRINVPKHSYRAFVDGSIKECRFQKRDPRSDNVGCRKQNEIAKLVMPKGQKIEIEELGI